MVCGRRTRAAHRLDILHHGNYHVHDVRCQSMGGRRAEDSKSQAQAQAKAQAQAQAKAKKRKGKEENEEGGLSAGPAHAQTVLLLLASEKRALSISGDSALRSMHAQRGAQVCVYMRGELRGLAIGPGEKGDNLNKKSGRRDGGILLSGMDGHLPVARVLQRLNLGAEDTDGGLPQCCAPTPPPPPPPPPAQQQRQMQP